MRKIIWIYFITLASASSIVSNILARSIPLNHPKFKKTFSPNRPINRNFQDKSLLCGDKEKTVNPLALGILVSFVLFAESFVFYEEYEKEFYSTGPNNYVLEGAAVDLVKIKILKKLLTEISASHGSKEQGHAPKDD